MNLGNDGKNLAGSSKRLQRSGVQGVHPRINWLNVLKGASGGGSVPADTVVNSMIDLVRASSEASMSRRGPSRDRPSITRADLLKERHKLHHWCLRVAMCIKVEYRSAKGDFAAR